MSFSGWWYHFRCQNLLPINSRIPLLPFIFLKLSPLTFLVQCLIQKYYYHVLSLPSSRARYSPHPHSQVFLQISTCLKLSSLHLVIVQIRLQTSTMTQPVIVVPVAVVVVMEIPWTRYTPLVFLEFLQRFSRNILGRGQLPGLKLAPRRVFLRPFLETKQRPCTVVLWASLPKQMKGGLQHLGIGTRSQTILTLGQPSMGNGVATLVLRQASIKLIF